ncbi:MAG: fibrillarin-like rRNA/tRNA 2'-O-methyltransferase [Candidatus Woesearchaeota archaeon]
MMSKLTALKKKANVPIKKGDKVLYLGASHGITAKIIADIVGEKGMVFCVELSPYVMKDLLRTCEENRNMIPFLGSASLPEEYKNYVKKVDIIYQDIAQRDQAEILMKNIRIFLKKSGHFLFAVKSRSIDVLKDPEEVLKEVLKKLKDYDIMEVVGLSNTHGGHYFIIGRKGKS